MEQTTDLFDYDPYNADTYWFHVFKDMVENGDVAKMGPHATTLYVVIKAHANMSTGATFPSIETIVTKSGMSRSTIIREMKTLEEFGYIIKHRVGRHNAYTLREKIVIRNEEGDPTAIASWDYIGKGVKTAVKDLKNVMMTGDLAGAKVINIKHLTVNLINGDNAVQNNISNSTVSMTQDAFDKLPAEMREKIKLAMEMNPHSDE